MIRQIDSLIDQLESVCDEFAYIADAESNWHVACRVSCYVDHVQRGIKGLREMQDYLSSLTTWQLNQLQAGYRDGEAC